MPIVDIAILGSIHRIACNAGEEQKLNILAQKLNDRLKAISRKSPSTSDTKLLVLNSLIMEDLLSENTNLSNSNTSPNSDETIYKTLDAVTEYVENLAGKLEKM